MKHIVYNKNIKDQAEIIKLIKRKQYENYDYEERKLELMRENFHKLERGRNRLTKLTIDAAIKTRQRSLAEDDKRKTLLLHKTISKTISEEYTGFDVPNKVKEAKELNLNSIDKIKQSISYAHIPRNEIIQQLESAKRKEHKKHRKILSQLEFTRTLENIRSLTKDMTKVFNYATTSIDKYK